MERILFFETALLKSTNKKAKGYDLQKVEPLKRLLSNTNAKLVLTSFNLEKQIDLVHIFEKYSIEVFDYFPCFQNKNSSKFKEHSISRYPTANTHWKVIDTHQITKNTITVKYFNEENYKKILRAF